MAGRAAQAAGQGAIAGGVAGFGDAEGDFGDRLAGGAYGAGIGAAVGGIASPLLEGAGRLVRRAFSGPAVRPAPGVDPATRVAEADEFGIPLTGGQASGDVNQIAREEAMRHAARGETAQRTMQAFDEGQAGAIRTAAEDMQGRFAGANPPVAGDTEVGDMVAAAARRRAQELRTRAEGKFTEAEAGGVEVRADAIKAAKQDISDRLAASDFPFDERLHPAAWRALQEIDRLAGLRGAQALKPGETIVGTSLKGIEQTRRRLAITAPTNAADAKALGIVRRAFDDWLDDAVAKELFTGNPAALTALKEARGLWSQYRGLTSPKTGDDAGRAIKAMLKADTTGQEVANFLYGSSIVNPPGRALRVATRLKNALGAQSEEWSAVRQGAWLRVIGGAEGNLSPAKIASNIQRFLDGHGKGVSTVLFSAEERAQMHRFAKVLRNTVPDARATNPSKGSYAMQRGLQAVTTGLAASLGFAGGGFAGAAGAAAAVPVARSMAGQAAARRAINPRLVQPLFRARALARLGAYTTGREAVAIGTRP